MNGKERVQATLAREPVDRLPIDMITTPAMMGRLLNDLSLADMNAVYDRFGIDMIGIMPVIKDNGCGNYYSHWFTKQLDEQRVIDNWGITWQKALMESGDLFCDVVDFPLKDAQSVSDVENFSWPDPAEDWDYSTLKGQALACGDRAVVGRSSAVFDDSWRMRGLDTFLMDLALNPDIARAILRHVCDYWKEFARLMLEASDGTIDLIWQSDDLGTQRGLWMAPDMCRDFVIPLIKERVDCVRDYNVPVIMHSCGGIYDVIGDIADAGVDVLNPIQKCATGMDRKRIKETFGDRLIFHGSVDQQDVLVFGSTDDVVAETKECIDVLGAGGGYIVMASHELEADIPTANVVAMYDTALEYGKQG